MYRQIFIRPTRSEHGSVKTVANFEISFFIDNDKSDRYQSPLQRGPKICRYFYTLTDWPNRLRSGSRRLTSLTTSR